MVCVYVYMVISESKEYRASFTHPSRSDLSRLFFLGGGVRGWVGRYQKG